MTCPKCQGTKTRKNGTILKTGSRVYQRVQCMDCGCNYKGDLIPKKAIS